MSREVEQLLRFVEDIDTYERLELALEEHEIKGLRGICYLCPVTALMEKLGIAGGIANPAMLAAGGAWIPTPAHIAKFIENFDIGRHPEFDAEVATEKGA